MTKLCRCVCCKGELEPAQQLRFLVETDTLNDPVHLARIRALPHANGKPLPVCKACQSEIESAPHRPRVVVKVAPLPRLLGALGALSVGLLLGNMFTPRG